MAASTEFQAFMFAAVALVLLLTSAQADGYAKYKDPKQPVAVRVRDLLRRMTLEEKIGQMTQIERANATAEAVQKYLVGSVLSGGGSAPAPNAAAAQWRDMVDSIQRAALSTRLRIPMLYGIDAVHGHNNVVNATIFPHNVGLGATRDPDLVRRIGAATAAEVRATGIPYAFAPCLAVCRDPRWGRCYESFSEDPEVVRSMTDAIVGLQGEPPAGHVAGRPYLGGPENVVACAKHFVGDGGTTHGIDENNTVATFGDLVRIHLSPYFEAVHKSVDTIMISYSSWNGVKMHANGFLINRILKGLLKFRGFAISDWQGIDRITSPPGENYTESVLLSINAGLDMIMVPYDYPTFFETLKSLVQGGFISMERIDDAVSRILRVKFSSGLFENPMSNPAMDAQLGSQAHRELAREAVRKSLVLLKNGKPGSAPLLPLSKKPEGRILVAGTHANNIGNQCGGWTITWQGENNRSTAGTTILEGIQAALGSQTEVVFQENPDRSFVNGGNFAYAIVVVGEPPYAEMYGDSDNLTIPLGGGDIINNVCGGVKCVVVLISGRPLVVEPFLGTMDAFVAAWLPGSEGAGVADVLFGDYPFQGRLPRTWFKSVDQLPMNVGDQHYDPLFPFGFGLNTTTTTA